MAIAATVCILAVGNLLGAVIKGVTGFGSAIILLCVWVSAVHLGLPAGTLQQAVLSECVTGWVLALPLLFVTRAHRTWDWRLVLSLGTFEAAGAPLGAALLAHLNPRYVELCMACLLLALIGLQCHTAGYLHAASHAIKRLLHRQDQTYEHMPAEEAVPAADVVKLQQLGSMHTCSVGDAPKDLIKTHEPSVQPPAQLLSEAALCSSRSSSPCSSVSRGSEGTQPADGTQPCDGSDSRTDSESQQQQQCSLGQGPELALAATQLSSCGEEPVGHGLIVVHAAAKGVPLAGAAPTVPHKPRSCGSSPSASPRAALLPKECADSSHPATHPCTQQSCCGGAPGSKQQEDTAAAASAGAVCWGAGQYSSWREWWVAMHQPHQLANNLRVLGLAAVAGTCAGAMAGMTGMGGPPLMFMFSVLRIPKEVVRGTNAVLNVLQWRILAYLSMGSFVREDTNLYVVCAASGVFGIAGGSVLAQRVNQEAFSRVLLLLMCLCCVLMFVAAAGWN